MQGIKTAVGSRVSGKGVGVTRDKEKRTKKGGGNPMRLRERCFRRWLGWNVRSHNLPVQRKKLLKSLPGRRRSEEARLTLLMKTDERAPVRKREGRKATRREELENKVGRGWLEVVGDEGFHVPLSKNGKSTPTLLYSVRSTRVEFESAKRKPFRSVPVRLLGAADAPTCSSGTISGAAPRAHNYLDNSPLTKTPRAIPPQTVTN